MLGLRSLIPITHQIQSAAGKRWLTCYVIIHRQGIQPWYLFTVDDAARRSENTGLQTTMWDKSQHIGEQGGQFRPILRLCSTGTSAFLWNWYPNDLYNNYLLSYWKRTKERAAQTCFLWTDFDCNSNEAKFFSDSSLKQTTLNSLWSLWSLWRHSMSLTSSHKNGTGCVQLKCLRNLNAIKNNGTISVCHLYS